MSSHVAGVMLTRLCVTLGTGTRCVFTRRWRDVDTLVCHIRDGDSLCPHTSLA